jgi:hypothetical protein
VLVTVAALAVGAELVTVIAAIAAAELGSAQALAAPALRPAALAWIFAPSIAARQSRLPSS